MSPQSYPLTSQFTSDDFNLLANDINEIVGTGAGDSGYGQTQLFVNHVNRGQQLRKRNWMELFYSIRFAAAHQGTELTTSANIYNGDFTELDTVIHTIDTIKDDIINIRQNKLNYTLLKMSTQQNVLSAMHTYLNPNQNLEATPDETWKVRLDEQKFEFRAKFKSEDARRQYFNAGGEIRIQTELSDYPTGYIPSSSWASLLDDVGNIIFSHIATKSSNNVGVPGVGFNEMTTTYQKVFHKKVTVMLDDPSPLDDVTEHQIEVWARFSLEEIGSMEFYVLLRNDPDRDPDGYLGYSGYGGYGGYDGYYPDQVTYGDWVEGNLSVYISQQRADDADLSNLGVVSEMPVYSIITDFVGIIMT